MLEQRSEILLSQRFFPEIGGSIRLLHELFSSWPHTLQIICHDYRGETGELVVNTEQSESGRDFYRANLLQNDWGLDSPPNALKHLRMAILARTLFRGASRIYCARIIPEALAGLLASRLSMRRIPLIAFVHGEEILACESSRQLKYLLSQVAARLDVVICNSEHTASLVEPYVKKDRIEVLTPGVATDDFVPLDAEAKDEIRRMLGLKPDSFYLLTLARLDQRKNHLGVIKAVERLRGSHPSLQYLIVGNGPMEHTLRREIEARNLSEHVQLISQVSDAKRIAYFQASDAFVMPSIQSATDLEGFGMVFLEAAACGLPSIAGNTGGQAEAVRDGQTGIVVDGTQSEQIQSAIQTLIVDSEKYVSFVSAARAFAEQNTWQEKRQRLQGILHERGL